MRRVFSNVFLLTSRRGWQGAATASPVVKNFRDDPSHSTTRRRPMIYMAFLRIPLATGGDRSSSNPGVATGRRVRRVWQKSFSVKLASAVTGGASCGRAAKVKLSQAPVALGASTPRYAQHRFYECGAGDRSSGRYHGSSAATGSHSGDPIASFSAFDSRFVVTLQHNKKEIKNVFQLNSRLVAEHLFASMSNFFWESARVYRNNIKFALLKAIKHTKKY